MRQRCIDWFTDQDKRRDLIVVFQDTVQLDRNITKKGVMNIELITPESASDRTYGVRLVD